MNRPPVSTLRSVLLLSSVMRRIDEFLLVKELNIQLLNDIVPDDLLHSAITPASAKLEHNYERLEMLGSFLNFPHFSLNLGQVTLFSNI
jgi:endoribonuclease Dicer